MGTSNSIRFPSCILSWQYQTKDQEQFDPATVSSRATLHYSTRSYCSETPAESGRTSSRSNILATLIVRNRSLAAHP